MIKKPNPDWFKLLKKSAVILFVAEGAAFAGSYLFWSRLNTDRDFRFYCHQNYPIVLEGYYKVGEIFDDVHNVNRIKQADLAVFNAKAAKQE